MTKETLLEVLSAVVFCALAVALINPMHFWMPSMAHMTVLALAAVAFAAFAVFVLRESARDERDEAHRALAGRAAFFAGSLVLILGILTQQSSGTIDPWLVAGLIAMVIAKVGVLVWSTHFR